MAYVLNNETNLIHQVDEEQRMQRDEDGGWDRESPRFLDYLLMQPLDRGGPKFTLVSEDEALAWMAGRNGHGEETN